MLSPQELVARFVIPYIRALVAIMLFQRGYSQVKISKLLGVSQPMVSRYIAEGMEQQLRKLSEVGIPREEVLAIARLLAEVASRGRKQDFVRILASYGNTVLVRGYLCTKHRELVPDLPLDCGICMKIFSQLSDPLIDELKRAYEILSAAPRAYELVPEVGMNIVVALPHAESVKEVVGFAGRIIRVGEKIEAVGEPLYGGSRHTALILLMVRRRWREIRAAIVVKYSEQCVAKLRKSGLAIVEIGPHRDPANLYRDIEEGIRQTKEKPDAVVDKGGLGLEPVIYIFGSSAMEVVERALKCIES